MRRNLFSVLFVLPTLVGCGAAVCQARNDQPAQAFCVPDGGGAAGQALTVEAQEQCGGCGVSAAQCEVTQTGNMLRLSLNGESCTQPNMACPAVCRISKFDCTVPALAAGEYTLQSTGLPDQQLTIRSGGAAGCRL